VEEKFKTFLNKMMREEDAKLKELIVIGMTQGEDVPYTHAIAIIRHDKDNNLIISDSHADNEHYRPAKPVGLRDKRLFKLGNLTDEYEIITLLRIEREQVNKSDWDQQEIELKYVMTGKEQVEAIIDKRASSATETNRTRASSLKKRRTKGSLSLNKSRKQQKK